MCSDVYYYTEEIVLHGTPRNKTRHDMENMYLIKTWHYMERIRHNNAVACLVFVSAILCCLIYIYIYMYIYIYIYTFVSP